MSASKPSETRKEIIEWNGKRYRRYPDANQYSDRNYYKSYTDETYLHRDIWRRHHGEIPDGYQIHHVDGDPSNNDIENLELVDAKEHQSQHARERIQAILEEHGDLPWRDKLTRESRKWHRSEEGLEWHRKQGREVYQKRLASRDPTVCDICGTEFEDRTVSGHARLCSNACRSRYRREAELDATLFECQECGELFWGNLYAKRTHCGKSCLGRANFREHWDR